MVSPATSPVSSPLNTISQSSSTDWGHSSDADIMDRKAALSLSDDPSIPSDVTLQLFLKDTGM